MGISTPPSVVGYHSVREEGMLLAVPSKCLEILSEVSSMLQGEPILGVSIVSIILSLKSFHTSFQGFKNKTPVQ